MRTCTFERTRVVSDNTMRDHVAHKRGCVRDRRTGEHIESARTMIDAARAVLRLRLEICGEVLWILGHLDLSIHRTFGLARGD